MREDFWDEIKGISIIAVVLIHSTGYLLTSGSFYEIVGLIFRQILNFAVPVFLFISGYFSFNTKETSNFNNIKNRFKRLLPPYIFWSFCFFLISIFILKHPLKLSDILEGLLLGTSIKVGYFVIVLLQFILITPILKKIKSKKILLISIALFSFIGLIYTYLTKFLVPNHFISQFPMSALPFFVWYPFFILGYYLSKYQPKINLINNNYLILISLLSISIVEGYLLKSYVNIEFGISQIKISSFILSLFICLEIYNKRNTRTSNIFLNFLGLNSYGIFLIHTLFISFFSKFLSFIWMSQEFKLLGLVVLPILSLLFSIITIQAIKLIMGSKSKYIVG